MTNIVKYISADTDPQTGATTYWFVLAGTDPATGYDFPHCEQYGIVEGSDGVEVVNFEGAPMADTDPEAIAVRNLARVTDDMRKFRGWV